MKDPIDTNLYWLIYGRSEAEVKEHLRRLDIKEAHTDGFYFGLRVGALIGGLIVVATLWVFGWLPHA